MQKILIKKESLHKGAQIISGDAQNAMLLIPAAGGGITLPQLISFKKRYLCFYAETPEDHSLTLELLAHTADQVYTLRFGIMPQFRTLICIDTMWFNGEILFPGHTPGQLKVVYHGGRIDPELVKSITLEAIPAFHDVRIRLSDMYLSDERPASYPIPDDKLIDELGQYKKKTWIGKTADIDELQGKLNALLNQAARYCVKDWSQYGGWTQKKIGQGTGFFTRIKTEGRWWLIDPEGYTFFSAGPDCVNTRSDCRIDDVEKLLDWIPSQDDPDYKDMFAGMRYHSRAEDNCRPNGLLFSFVTANLFRVFGTEWHTQWSKLVHIQLKANGMNTIANWSDKTILGTIPVPYVWMLPRFPETQLKIFRDFPDVLSDEFQKDAQECAQLLRPLANDPYMIGYFLRNEPSWAFVNNLIIADEVLYNPVASVCKDKLIQFLEQKYITPHALSKSWNHPFGSFDDLRKPIRNASQLSETALADQKEFSKILLKAYVTIPSESCREADPHHMNLGMRWAWISDPDIVTGWENFDVFSINCYAGDPAAALDNVCDLGVDLPILIGEFHFGALDTGLTATGLKGTANQQERGKSYRYYCECVAAHPNGVGCHWFQFYDQFPLGRFDGENYNIGLFDMCSLPNEEMMKAIRDCAQTIYQVADGAITPTKEIPQYIPMIAF